MKKYKFDRNKVFTNLPEDIAEATKRIGELVAVSDILVKLKDSIEKGDFHPLSMSSHLYYPYRVNSSDGYLDHSHCIFMNDLETEEERKYRPFKSNAEFIANIGDVGHVLKTRLIAHEDNKFYSEAITGFTFGENSLKDFIYINGYLYPYPVLFDKYEYWSGQEWHRFGVIDDEEV
jgi:hypothetical protein